MAPTVLSCEDYLMFRLRMTIVKTTTAVISMSMSTSPGLKKIAPNTEPHLLT